MKQHVANAYRDKINALGLGYTASVFEGSWSNATGYPYDLIVERDGAEVGRATTGIEAEHLFGRLSVVPEQAKVEQTAPAPAPVQQQLPLSPAAPVTPAQ